MTSAGEITQAVADALTDAQLLPRDDGAVALVMRYAAALDANPYDIKLLSDLGPKLLAGLVALGMAPAGRGAKGGGQVAPVASKLDELKARRDARTNRA
jgi:hypothetical protein